MSPLMQARIKKSSPQIRTNDRYDRKHHSNNEIIEHINLDIPYRANNENPKTEGNNESATNINKGF